MLAARPEDTPEIDDSHAVQLELGHRRGAGGCSTDDLYEIETPGEMLVPLMLARMVKRDPLPGSRVDGGGVRVLGVVAALTRVGEVGEPRLPAFR
jgi:hypothetical protein